MADRPTTIRDVAAATGMSISTVSRAIHAPALLNKETLAIVTAAIEQLHYRPSLTAQNLRGSRTNLILVVVPSLNPFFLEIFRGAEQAAGEAGYGVLVGHTDRTPARERHFMEQASASRADGVILVTSVDLPALSASCALPPAIVALDVNSGTELPTVRVDHVAGAETATRYLIEIGHRAIGHIAGPAASGMTGHRIDGFRRALAAADIAIDPRLCGAGDFTVESGDAAMTAILDQAVRPTAMFVANDQMAIGAIRAIRRCGLSVPDDISVIGFDDERMAGLYDPALTTIRIPTFDIGYRAMEQLIGLLAGAAIVRDIALETELIVRKSTAPLTDRVA